MVPGGKKASKPIFKADLPFTETRIPQTSVTDQEVILDLLCNLIEPLGQHRKAHLTPSKGRKRKRNPPTDSDIDINDAPAPAPPIADHLLVGLNSITRHLSTLAKAPAPSKLPESKAHSSHSPSPTSPATASLAQVALLILPTLAPKTSLTYAHLPTLLHLSSMDNIALMPLSSPSSGPRLVNLPPSSENRIASALHIPRVGAIAVLEGAPGADPLVQYVREKLGTVECGWVKEALEPQWTGVKGSF